MNPHHDTPLPAPVHSCLVGLGSNRDGAVHLSAAIAAIGRRCRIVRQGPLLRTPAEGGPAGAADYFNQALRIDTPLTPDELKALFQAIERGNGRTPASGRLGEALCPGNDKRALKTQRDEDTKGVFEERMALPTTCPLSDCHATNDENCRGRPACLPGTHPPRHPGGHAGPPLQRHSSKIRRLFSLKKSFVPLCLCV